jgi:hypothetical protein
VDLVDLVGREAVVLQRLVVRVHRRLLLVLLGQVGVAAVVALAVEVVAECLALRTRAVGPDVEHHWLL